MDEYLDLSMMDELQIYDDTGDPEGAAIERKKKREAIETLHNYQVFEDIPSSQADEEGLKYIRARWEDQQRPGAEQKYRYVAQEFAWQEKRDDCFAASSTAQTSRTIDVIAAKEGYATFGADCIKAYYQAKQKEHVCVKPPTGYITRCGNYTAGYQDRGWQELSGSTTRRSA